MEIELDGVVYDVPDDATEAEIRTMLGAPTTEAAPKPEPTGNYSPLSVLGEFASAGNRAVMDTADFFGPGAINAGLRLAGSDHQIPTFAGTFDETRDVDKRHPGGNDLF